MQYFRKSIFDTSIARKYISSNYGHMFAMIESLKIKGSVYLLNAPVIIIREFGAPFQEPIPTNLILKHIWYLLYLGTIYPKIFWYSCRYVMGIPYRRVFNPGGKIVVKTSESVIPTLSVAIPTYNGEYTILETIRSVDQEDITEIVISDNCSTDNTETLIKNLNNSKIRYFRNEQNLGFDQNCDLTCQKNNGGLCVVVQR